MSSRLCTWTTARNLLLLLLPQALDRTFQPRNPTFTYNIFSFAPFFAVAPDFLTQALPISTSFSPPSHFLPSPACYRVFPSSLPPRSPLFSSYRKGAGVHDSGELCRRPPSHLLLRSLHYPTITLDMPSCFGSECVTGGRMDGRNV